MKPIRAPERKPNWRLSKTLSRKLDFRPIEEDDVKYAWAAYKKGALVSMGGAFAEPQLTADEFKTAFAAEVTTTYHGAWTLFAETKKGYLPIGIVLGFYSHPNPKLAPFMIVGDMLWFPWSSARNRIESAVNFFNKIRREIPMIDYVGQDDKRFFEMLAIHGVMRRVGTTYSTFGKPVAVFETR